MKQFIIGIDCATQPPNVGIALGVFAPEQTSVLEVRIASRDERPAAIICDWIRSKSPTLLAFDAPLGWPDALRNELVNHEAGEAFSAEPDAMFQRYTDHDIRNRFGKKPLEVGANLIARTGHAALKLLSEVRREVAAPIPLAWQSGTPNELSAIEVYPAVTLRYHRLPFSGYRKAPQREERRGLIEKLRDKIELPRDSAVMESSPDALDAAICVLAGMDFLLGDSRPPRNKERAKREGWIWVPEPGT